MRKLLNVVLIASAGWMTQAPAMAVPVLSIVPAATTLSVGGNVSVDLVVSGLNSVNEIVSRFDLDVFFDPAVLHASVVNTLFAPWGVGADVQLQQNFVAPGHVEIVLTALKTDAELDVLQGDSISLSTITLLGIADGFSNITFGADPTLEREVLGRNHANLNQVTTGTCIAVGTGACPAQPVPEPPAAALVLLALGAGGWWLRRGKPSAGRPRA